MHAHRRPPAACTAATALVLIVAVLGILVGVNCTSRGTASAGTSPRTSATASRTQTKKSWRPEGRRHDPLLPRAADSAAGQARMKEYQDAVAPHQGRVRGPRRRTRRKAREYDVSARGRPWWSSGARAGSRSATTPSRTSRTPSSRSRATARRRSASWTARASATSTTRRRRGYSAREGGAGQEPVPDEDRALLREGAVPADCTVAGGGRARHRPAAAGGRRAARLREDGRARPAGDGGARVQGHDAALVGLLKEWNLEAGRRRGGGRLPGTWRRPGPETPLGVQYPSHEITKDLTGLATAFHTARSLKAGAGLDAGRVRAEPGRDGPRRPGARPTSRSGTPVKLDPGKDKPGPVSLGAVATIAAEAAPDARRPPRPPRPRPRRSRPKKEGRVVAFGDADFASNTFLQIQGNRDFFLNAVAWLAEDADLISIRAARSRRPADVPDRTPAAGGVRDGAPPVARPVRGARHRELVAAAELTAMERGPLVRTLVVLAVALGLGAYIYFSRASRSRSPTRSKEKVFTLDKAKVKEVDLASLAGAHLVKEGVAWRLTAPQAAPRGRRPTWTAC